jgi:molybdopterin-biosynthesis enzyme MoeA-like protein
MLPEGAEFLDNPIGTACGFAATIELDFGAFGRAKGTRSWV